MTTSIYSDVDIEIDKDSVSILEDDRKHVFLRCKYTEMVKFTLVNGPFIEIYNIYEGAISKVWRKTLK